MKTLHKYITGQVVATLLLTVAVFTFVVLLLNFLHDVLPMLLGGHVPLSLLGKAIGLLLPFALVYALPMGFITATLLVFGRFSADHELTATRASGVSLLALISPVLLISLGCCGLSAWFNMELGPKARAQFVNMRYDLYHVAANVQFPEGQLVSIPGYQLYVEKNDNGDLQGLSIYRMQNATNWDTLTHAAHGRLSMNRELTQPILDLNDVRIIHRTPRGTIGITAFDSLELNLSLDAATNHTFKPKISDMTFSQLREELQSLETNNLTLATVTSPGALAGLQGSAASKTNASPAEAKALYLQAAKIRNQNISQVHVEMHRQVAFSFACFGFTMIGIPLGIRVHRKETNIGMAVALLLVLVYYGLCMLGYSLANRPELYPELIIWLPNFLFQGIGAALLWRANRGL